MDKASTELRELPRPSTLCVQLPWPVFLLPRGVRVFGAIQRKGPWATRDEELIGLTLSGARRTTYRSHECEPDACACIADASCADDRVEAEERACRDLNL